MELFITVLGRSHRQSPGADDFGTMGIIWLCSRPDGSDRHRPVPAGDLQPGPHQGHGPADRHLHRRRWGGDAAILINTPRHAASVATCFEEAPLPEKVRPKRRLGVGTMFSFRRRLFGILVLVFVSPIIANSP